MILCTGAGACIDMGEVTLGICGTFKNAGKPTDIWGGGGDGPNEGGSGRSCAAAAVAASY